MPKVVRTCFAALIVILSYFGSSTMTHAATASNTGQRNQLYIYRSPDFSLLKSREINSSLTAGDFKERMDYLNSYADAFYKPAQGVGAMVQRAPITPETIYHAKYDWKLSYITDTLPYANQVVFARYLFEQGNDVQLLMLGNVDSSTVDMAHEGQAFGYNKALSADGVPMVANEMKHLVRAVTSGSYSAKVSVIYENEVDLFNAQAGRPIITAQEYYKNFYDVRIAAAKMGLTNTINSAAISDGWEDPLVNGTNRFRTWLSENFSAKANMLRSDAFKALPDAVKEHVLAQDLIGLNLYTQNAINFKAKYEGIVSFIGALNDRYRGEFGIDLFPVTNVRLQEVGILYNDWKLRGLGYNGIRKLRETELPKILGYLVGRAEVSVYTQSFTAYGSTGAQMMRDLHISADWTGRAWEVFNTVEQVTAQKLKATLNQ